MRILILLACLGFGAGGVGAEIAPVAAEKWWHLQTPNFTVFTSGRVDQARLLAARLEQFREAYASLAGVKSVASVPILVFAFPNNEAFLPFQPLYQGQPTRVGGFFQRDHDENIIAVNLELLQSGSMELIFHEYAHLLMRHNDRAWPLWLKEGMAEVYSTFTIERSRVCLGVAKKRHLDFLRQQSLMPLTELFAVGVDSPQYNEREHRGLFYAQSWALTHYLVLGNHPVRKSQFRTFARRLREGVAADAAFSEAFRIEFTEMEAELKRYVQQGKFEPAYYQIRNALRARPGAERTLPQVEVLFQLGNLLLHLSRLDEAEAYFKEARRIAPESARPLEGLGLVAARNKNYAQAIDHFHQAASKGSVNFRVHDGYARALLTGAGDRVVLDRSGTSEVTAKARQALQRSTQLMPSFAPSHYLLGLVESSGGNQASALQHLRTAIELAPDNHYYSLALAELQVRRRDYAAAREILNGLSGPDVEPELRQSASALLKTLDRATSTRGSTAPQ